jgi:hypothetical protein
MIVLVFALEVEIRAFTYAPAFCPRAVTSTLLSSACFPLVSLDIEPQRHVAYLKEVVIAVDQRKLATRPASWRIFRGVSGLNP